MRFCLFLLFALAFSACKKNAPPAHVQEASVGKKAIRSEVQPWPGSWWTAKGKIYVDMGSGQIPLNLTLRAEEGKAIWFSASAFGLMEVARGRADLDSIRILDKFNNRCIRADLNGLGNYLPVPMGISQFQHFLMGRIFWDSLETGNKITRNDTTRISGMQSGIEYTAEVLSRFSLLRAEARMPEAAVFLENRDFRQISGFPVAFQKEVKSQTGTPGNIQETVIRLEFSRFEFLNQAPDMEFSLPPDCTPFDLK